MEIERFKRQVAGEIEAIFPAAFAASSGKPSSLANGPSDPSGTNPRKARRLVAASAADSSLAKEAAISVPQIDSVQQLLALHDREFVLCCYQVLLRREPDATGFASHLGALRSGAQDKLEIVCRFKDSAEGKRANVPLKGLRRARAWSLVQRLPLVGHAARWLDAALRLADTQRRILSLERTLAARTPAPSVGNSPTTSDSAAESPQDFDQFYLEFENHFRGSRESIKSRHEVYLPVVAQLVQTLGDQPVLDIACGRGEWLELLQEHHYPAEGVDINAASLAGLDARNLVVHQADALQFLRGVKDNTYLMVTAFHLVEHLPLNVMLRLIDEIRRVLMPGGKIILETPNPANLIVGAHTFYMDPTHRNPLPPTMLEFVVRQRGFHDTTIRGLHPPPETNVIRGIEGAEVLNDLLFGSQDYAVIGTK